MAAVASLPSTVTKRLFSTAFLLRSTRYAVEPVGVGYHGGGANQLVYGASQTSAMGAYNTTYYM